MLVVGLGPAGYTLAHYLVNEGFGVVAIDGLKIEPPDRRLAGGPGRPPEPIARWADIYHPLDQRVLEGFGGVSEYGITVRWDKNFLSLIHLTLARRTTLKIYGGVRFGGALPLDEVWAHGIHHVAIAAGAGRPTIIDIKNNLIRGIRKASDFLMALQLTGAFKADALSNLQVRLPGGGHRRRADRRRHGHRAARLLPAAGREDPRPSRRAGRGHRFGPRLRAPRRGGARASSRSSWTTGAPCAPSGPAPPRNGEAPDFVPLVRAWGGVTLAYRKRLQDAPAYRLNHEEVEKALEEGIAFAEGMDPIEAIPDAYGHVAAMAFTTHAADGAATRVELPARTVLVAAGTAPNVTYEKEHPGSFELDGKARFFKGFRAVRTAAGDVRARRRSERLLHLLRP